MVVEARGREKNGMDGVGGRRRHIGARTTNSGDDFGLSTDSGARRCLGRRWSWDAAGTRTASLGLRNGEKGGDRAELRNSIKRGWRWRRSYQERPEEPSRCQCLSTTACVLLERKRFFPHGSHTRAPVLHCRIGVLLKIVLHTLLCYTVAHSHTRLKWHCGLIIYLLIMSYLRVKF
jgi:hypothetical protein